MISPCRVPKFLSTGWRERPLGASYLVQGAAGWEVITWQTRHMLVSAGVKLTNNNAMSREIWLIHFKSFVCKYTDFARDLVLMAPLYHAVACLGIIYCVRQGSHIPSVIHNQWSKAHYFAIHGVTCRILSRLSESCAVQSKFAFVFTLLLLL